ncbi:divergent polysaccharide deacetylase family protein [Pacificibacter marinus]|uniref:Divergent polysaccharide deacetylase n=1 Tax=Pacificibacter marinus TaxID=658057 RepID=A0A1Y5RKX0_9RHOB|nr:divergent polysaccharide deacetylase family protein [Pacificibacter marinus]SEK17655.1 Divergent polysaccharide deacetylase [Pacificibacter marinus]SLN19890.1 Divergent polysaccharide deacetylase [Pacificibacter marinus]
MGRGILAGLVWGSIVGFGIMTVANQMVEKVSLTPISAAPDMRADDAVSSDETVPDESVPEDVAPSASNEPNTPSTSLAPSMPISPDMAQDMPLDMSTPKAVNTPNLSATKPDEMATETTPDTLSTPKTETAASPDIMAPSPLSEPMADTREVPDVGGDTPVVNSPQAMELTTPEKADLPLQIDPKLPAQTQMSDRDIAPETAPSKLTPQGQKTIGTKVGSFTDRQDNLKSMRLPSVSGSAQEDAAPMVVADDLPALVAFSADYTKLGKAPEMSVILVDIGEIDPNATLLANLPFPVTFAVDALAPGATERAQMYRQNGFEVLALIGLPEGATAQDVAVTITQARDLMPVSIGFLDVPSASFQASRDVAAQVVASAASSGHGLVSFSRGLNAMMQESKRADLPAALVFRDFDGRDQDVSAIKRFLDQAAFRSGIDEDIILVGRAKSDTLKALVEWSLGNRAASVEIVPVSFLLTAGDTAKP